MGAGFGSVGADGVKLVYLPEVSFFVSGIVFDVGAQREEHGGEIFDYALIMKNIGDELAGCFNQGG